MKLSCKWFKCLKWTKNEDLGDTNEQKKLILKEIGSEWRASSEKIRKTNSTDFSVTRTVSVSVSEPSSPIRSTKFW